MSDILQKSVTSLQKIIKNFNAPNSGLVDVLPQSYNRKLEVFVSDLKTSSNEDQDKLILETLAYVKKVFAQPAPDKDDIGYCLMLCKYCMESNYDTSFAAIQTVKLIEHGNKRHKKLGYTAVPWFLKPKDELLILLINTIQKDILSSDMDEICLGLKAVTLIFNQDLLLSLLPRIEDRLIHADNIVRNKALLAIHHYVLHNKQQGPPPDRLLSKLLKCLSDTCLDVVISAIMILHTLAEKDYGSKFVLAVPSFLKIFDMLITHRVPMCFETKNLAVPHLQVKLAQLLVMLVKIEPSYCQQVVLFYKDVIQKTQGNNLYAFAIIYECILGIIKLDTTSSQNDLIQEVVSNLLNSNEVNLKFMGLECLVEAAKSSKHSVVLEFQPLIMQCLTHEDEHLKFKTISLLIAIANPANCNSVFTKIAELLNTMKSPMYKQDTINKLFSLIPKLPLQSLFVVNFINKDLYVHNSMITSEFINIVVRHLKKETSTEKKTAVLLAYHDLLNTNEPICQTLSFICISSWVFGEWWFEDVSINSLEIQRCLIKLLKFRDSIIDQEPLLWLLSALRKLCTQSGVYPPELPECLAKCAEGFKPYKTVSLKINELLKIMENLPEIYEVFKEVDKEIQFEPTFSCLDSYAYKCLSENTAEHYQPKPPAKAEEHLKLINQINPPIAVTSLPLMANSTSFMSMDSLKELVSMEASSLSSTSEAPSPRVWTLEGREETLSAVSEPSSLEHSIQLEEETKKNNALFLGLQQDASVPESDATVEFPDDSIPPIYFEADS